MERYTTILLAVTLAVAAPAAEIQGTVVVERKLTKRKVTPSTGLYQRGVAVELGKDAPQDPLSYERSHVVVYLEGKDSPEAARDAARRSASVEQRDRRFSPDLVTIPAGGSVVFPNFDPIFHNVFSLSKPKSFDLGNYPKGESRNVTFPKDGVVFVYCHLHPNMAATVVVTPNPWNTIADPTGHFTLGNVPPGAYTVVAWHKTGGIFRQKIQLTESGVDSVRFYIPLPAEDEVASSDHQHQH